MQLIADYLDKNGFKNYCLGFESGSLTHYLMTGFKERALYAVCMDGCQKTSCAPFDEDQQDR
jgi:hypothetical protein